MTQFDKDFSRFPYEADAELVPYIAIIGETDYGAKIKELIEKSSFKCHMDVMKEDHVTFEKKSSKSKKGPYDGILKANWYEKHQTRVPHIVIAVFENDFLKDFDSWDEIQDDILKDINDLRDDFGGHPIELLLAFVHNGEEIDSSEEKRQSEGRCTMYIYSFIFNNQ